MILDSMQVLPVSDICTNLMNLSGSILAEAPVTGAKRTAALEAFTRLVSAAATGSSGAAMGKDATFVPGAKEVETVREICRHIKSTFRARSRSRGGGGSALVFALVFTLQHTILSHENMKSNFHTVT